MQDIQSTTVQVKLSDGHEDQCVLVHDRRRIIAWAEPNSGKVGTHPDNTMLVGTKKELEAEIARLQLEPLKRRSLPREVRSTK